MSWVTIIWSMVASACLTLAAIHLLVWCKKRTAWANLFFALMAVATAGLAATELWMMGTETPGQFGTALRWVHVPAFALIVGLVCFVRTYLGTGRRWLAWTTCAVRAFSLLLNFLMEPNVNYREITRLRHIPFLGDSVSVCEGVPSPWNLVGHLSLLLLVIFVADAAVQAWRRGDRREALVVGGSLLFFVLAATVQTMLTRWHVFHWPETASLFFMGIVATMAYEMSREALRAAQLSEDLLESEARYRGIFEGAIEGMYRTSPLGKNMVANPAFAKMLGYGSAEDVVLAIEDTARQVWVDPDERSRFVRLLEEKEIVRGYECQLKRKDGTRIWVSLNSRAVRGPDGRVVYFEGFIDDVTDRKQMEQEVQKAAEEWQTTFDSVQDLVMILDREFKVVRVNAAAKSFFGLPTESILGSHCHSLMHGTEEPVEGCPLVKMMQSKRHEETELYDETRHAWFRVSADPIFNEEGEIRQIVHSAKDITEQRKLETETFASRRELLRTERLLRMGELTASLAHELNQPLTSILSNTRAALRFIQSDTLDRGELTEILQDIANDDKRAGNIIRSLRSMLKPEEGERELIAINDVLREVVTLFHSEAIIRRIHVETDFADPLLPVKIDKVQLEQVAINLMMNAADSMLDVSENRRIVIRTQAADDGGVLVAIRDFGPGIDEKELARIFEPFFTTKRSGLGMGLSLSRSIIEGQGGHIRAENNPDEGATFYFNLPAGKEE